MQASKQTAENLWKNLPGFIANRLHYLVIPALLIVLFLLLPIRAEEKSMNVLQMFLIALEKSYLYSDERATVSLCIIIIIFL